MPNGSFEFKGGSYRRSDDHVENYGSGSFYGSNNHIASSLAESLPHAASRASDSASDVVRSIRLNG